MGQIDYGYTWQDLVLPEDELERLRSLSRYLRLGERYVSGQSGNTSIRRMPARPVLFLGAAGTGKTMAAQIVAADAGVPIHTFDLAAALASDSPGFDHLSARAFQSAARDGAILIVDGAGMLLPRPAPADWRGRRSASPNRPSEGGGPADADSHDTGETSLARLLERTERFDGLVIFTSTVTHGIGPAVIVRFRAVVTFPLPDTAARKEIWRRSLPADRELTESNLDYLAGWLQWPGGTIHRCCLAAADEASREGVPVQLRHVAGVLDQLHHSGGRPAGTPAPPPGPIGPGPDTTPPAPIRSGTDTTPPGPDRSDPAVPPPPAPVRTGRTMVPGRADSGAGPVGSEAAAGVGAARPGRRWPLAAGVVVAVAVIAGIVALVTAGSARPGAVRTAYVDAVRVSLPPTWRQSTPTARPSLGLTGELAAVSPAPARGELVIGRMAPGETAPLPQALLATLPSTVTPQIVKVGRLVFYRYPGAAPAGGSGGQSIYSMPTTSGTVVGVCRSQARFASFTSSCERVLGTVQLASGSALPLTLSTGYARQLNAVMGRLNTVRSSAGPQLAAGIGNRAQAAAATKLALAHGQAASALVHLTAGVAAAANAALAHALQLTANAYSALAHAAAHSDAPAYRRARADLASSAQALSLAFAQLRRLGYQVA